MRARLQLKFNFSSPHCMQVEISKKQHDRRGKVEKATNYHLLWSKEELFLVEFVGESLTTCLHLVINLKLTIYNTIFSHAFSVIVNLSRGVLFGSIWLNLEQTVQKTRNKIVDKFSGVPSETIIFVYRCNVPKWKQEFLTKLWCVTFLNQVLLNQPINWPSLADHQIWRQQVNRSPGHKNACMIVNLCSLNVLTSSIVFCFQPNEESIRLICQLFFSGINLFNGHLYGEP